MKGRTRPVTLSLSVLGALALGITGCTSPGGGGTATPSQGGCVPVEVLAARGTAEPQSGSLIMGGLSNGIAQQTGGRVYQIVFNSNDYFGGPSAGAANAIQRMKATAASCPTTKFVFTGYSSGAMTIVTLMGQVPADLAPKVAAAVLYGSPYYKSSSPAAAGSAKGTANGLIPLVGVPAAYAGKTLDICNSGDPVCGAGVNVITHISYGGSQAEGIAFAVGKVKAG